MIEGFPEDGVLGHTGSPAEKVDPQAQAQQEMLQRFFATLHSANLVEANSNRGLTNKVIADNAHLIVQAESFKRLIQRINEARFKGEDRIYMTEEQEQELQKDLVNTPSPNIWIALLSTLQYAVVESLQESKWVILW